jgi:hypothetical protein
MTLRERAELRTELIQILHRANTGLITQDTGDTTRYSAMADAVIDYFTAPARWPRRAA